MWVRVSTRPGLLVLPVGMASCGGAEPAAKTPIPAGSLVIMNGTVIDGTGAEPVADWLIVIQGERIAVMGPAADYNVPSDARTIDAQDGTMLPGVIDSHIHFAGSPRARRGFLLEGVTSVCDLGSTPGDFSKLEQTQTDGQRVARGFAAGPMFPVPGGKHAYAGESAYAIEVSTPEEARPAASAKASPPQFGESRLSQSESRFLRY